jgi:DNA-binding NarL/FixJ family response regulator
VSTRIAKALAEDRVGLRIDVRPLAMHCRLVAAISVLLVDDSRDFLRIAARFLEAHEHIAVVGAVDNAREALAELPRLRPDIIVIDLEMPEVSGLETIPQLRAELPQAGIVALTLLDEDAYRKAALDAGADAFVSKDRAAADLLPVVHRVAEARRAGTPLDPRRDVSEERPP